MWNAYEKRLMGILIATLILGVVLFGRTFFSSTTLILIANQLPEYGLIALALMMTLIISGLNLSIVSMTTLSGVIGAMVMEKLSYLGGISIFIGIMVMVIIGFITGILNGSVVSFLNVSPILTTLGTMLFYQGIALNLTKGGAITSFDDRFVGIGMKTYLWIPLPMIIMLVVMVYLNYLLNHNEFGKQIYRIGKNKESAIYSGINVAWTVLKVYGIAGILAGITAVIMTARYNSIRVDYGSSYLMNSIVVVILGGCHLEGGKGTIKGVILALLIVSLVVRIMNMAYIDPNLSDVVLGCILIVNLLVQRVTGSKKVN